MLAYSVVAVALASFAAAQNSTNSTVDIAALSATTKAQWCAAQQIACPELCGSASDTTTNNCDPTTLVVDCLCSNGSAPGLQYYINTIDTFLCEETYIECKADNAGDATAQEACDTAELSCGTLNPANYTAATTSSSASATATSTSATGSAASGAATSTSSKAAAPTMAMAREIGTGAFALGALGLGLLI